MGQQRVVAVHQSIGQRHDFAEHITGGIGDADVVPLALGHFHMAVRADEQRCDDHHLPGQRITGVFFLLKFSAYQIVEQLIAAPHFHIGVDADAVPALQERVENFMEPDVDAIFVAGGEVFAGQDLSHGFSGGQLDDLHEVHLGEPFTVIAHFEMVRICQENLTDLGNVGFGVRVDLLAAENRARAVATGGVTDAGGVVTDDDDGFVPPFLELPHDAQRHGMTERDIGGGWVHAEFDPKWLPCCMAFFKLGAKVLLRQNPFGTAGKGKKLIVDGEWHGVPGLCLKFAFNGRASAGDIATFPVN